MTGNGGDPAISQNGAGGLPIVWIPGHLCGPWLYAPQLAAFAAGHPTVIADTLRDDDLGAMAERLLATAPPRFVVAGLSMGGMVAMEVMARAPERVAGAVLMDTDPTAARPKECAWRSDLLAEARRTGTQAYVDRFVPKFFVHDSEIAAQLGPMVRAMALETPADVMHAQALALDTRREMLGPIEGFAAPVEVIVGEADRICPPRLHPPIVEACRDAALTVLPGVGHIATLEAAEAVNGRIAALLARVSQSDASAR
ncbi:alpha/beta fold hydrolase [Limibaculum sp. M0105]|uniref:Alpha/beta fold hydrolase n=1 Tax=Thermohalobaculum xanthum TaxID=2753746 RepID=A0A8J7M9G4_9RHOB|nr:alpha/beta fold hydrolase [Thermohalobaculum xanthum]MBK0400791.1 alpha/beta fold hydrolase [Thermohalobaculum xanthum]